jgi:hypothetical protein
MPRVIFYDLKLQWKLVNPLQYLAQPNLLRIDGVRGLSAPHRAANPGGKGSFTHFLVL